MKDKSLVDSEHSSDELHFTVQWKIIDKDSS